MKSQRPNWGACTVAALLCQSATDPRVSNTELTLVGSVEEVEY